jgi:hypothetical protein
MKRHAEARSAQFYSTMREAVSAAREIAQNSSRPRQVVALGTGGRLLRYLNFGFPEIPKPPVRRPEIQKAVGRWMLEKLTNNTHSPGA